MSASAFRRTALALACLEICAPAQSDATAAAAARDPAASGSGTPASASGDLTAGFAVPAGCEVSLWAESPLFYNPTAIDIDPQGRVWVTEAVNYRQWDGRNPGLHHDAGDRVMVLEDKDGDGVAESSSVFAQDADLVSPLGICWLPDKVLVSCSPTVWAYYDDDGDLHADRKEVFLTGFGGPNHDHGAHSFTQGPDGRLYMALGNAGPHIVTDRSGWTLRSGSAYDGGGERLAGNRPGLVSDDGRAYVGGLILRCNTDGTGLTVLAHNFRNPYEVAVDSFGDLWTFDNDDDGNQGCRVTNVIEGGNYGYMSADGSRFWQADRRPGQNTQRAHWHQDDPGVAPTTLITGSGGPTGVCVYEGDALPEPLRGALFCADAGRNCVFALKQAPDRSQGVFLWPVDAAPPVNGLTPYGRQLTGLLVSRPSHEGDETWRLFRPSDVCVAPDGSVLVADWFDPGVGGHMAGDREAYGRLLRVSATGSGKTLGAQASPPADLAQALDALGSPSMSVRAQGWAALADVDADGLDAIDARCAAEAPDSALGARLIWARAAADHSPRVPPRPAGADRDWHAASAWARAALTRGADIEDLVPEDLFAGFPELDPVLASALRGAPFAAHAGLFRAFQLGHFGWLAWEGKGDEFVADWRSQAGEELDEPLQWSGMRARLACQLHTESLVPAFATRAGSERLDRAAREESLTALAFCRSREAAEGMLTLALAGPADTREVAAFWVRHNDAADWRAYDLARHLQTAEAWTDAQIVWRSGPVTGGSLPVDVDISGSRRVALVATPADNGNGADWADWLAPRFTGVTSAPASPHDIRLAVAGAPAPLSASAGWGSVHVGANCDGGPLAVDGVAYSEGFGTHAPSEISFAVPEGAARLSVTAALDDGGTQQPGAPTKVEFIVYADRAAVAEAAAAAEVAQRAALLETLRTPGADLGARITAAEKLAADPQGGAQLLAEAAAGRLDALAPDEARAELLDAIAAAIFTNPDLGVRALASEHFTRPDLPALPPMSELVALPGDRRAGAALFFGEARCSSCHAMSGRGGDVGPELTAIRTKLGRAELLDAILNPSAAIGAGFESVTLTLRDGRMLAGLLQADGATVLLKDGTGARHAFDAADIVERRASKLSLMPQDIARGLSPQQLADLCAFLAHDPDAPPRFGPPVTLWNGANLAGWDAVPNTSAWSVRTVDGAAVLHDEGQPVGYIRTQRAFTSFELTVEWRFPDPARPGNSGALLRVQSPDEVWPRSIECQLNSGDAGDIWNIGDFPMVADAARTSGRRTVKLLPSSERPLGEWNTYRITLRDGDLALEVNGQVQNRAHWCAELPGGIALQSEGAPIEFRRVELREIIE